MAVTYLKKKHPNATQQEVMKRLGDLMGGMEHFQRLAELKKKSSSQKDNNNSNHVTVIKNSPVRSSKRQKGELGRVSREATSFRVECGMNNKNWLVAVLVVTLNPSNSQNGKHEERNRLFVEGEGRSYTGCCKQRESCERRRERVRVVL
eukprot:CAMPEP_0194038116 /NCGR_PEP_ID=MMETSP0009_2-20130614/10382_1 /TAXON_ID=210454 /ORGANISM="Grammatophora oceanica, Strain CCMP 410" /LENGTH=148 /DNA_ID=CAMNT_0038680517 /DNA_START=98 /DNA_END=542 /DNA_ORIENTATION=+